MKRWLVLITLLITTQAHAFLTELPSMGMHGSSPTSLPYISNQTLYLPLDSSMLPVGVTYTRASSGFVQDYTGAIVTATNNSPLLPGLRKVDNYSQIATFDFNLVTNGGYVAGPTGYVTARRVTATSTDAYFAKPTTGFGTGHAIWTFWIKSSVPQLMRAQLSTSPGYVGVKRTRFFNATTEWKKYYINGTGFTANTQLFISGFAVGQQFDIVAQLEYRPSFAETAYTEDLMLESSSATRTSFFNNILGTTTPPIEVAAWGDSLTQIYHDTGTSYVERVEQAGGDDIRINSWNMGVGGDAASQVAARFNADSSKWGYVTIIYCGYNDYALLHPAGEAETAIASMVANLQAQGNNKFLVLSIPTGAGETIGSPGYNFIMSINAHLAASYPNNFFDMRAYLLTQGNGSTQDNTDVANGVVPSSLRYDTIHPTTGSTLLQGNKLYEVLLAKGFISSTAQPARAVANSNRYGTIIETAATNIFSNPLAPATQNITVTAVPHTFSFYGTGSVTASGTGSFTLNGTGANNRVTQTFTPTAGTLTLTLSGSVTSPQLETGTYATTPALSASATTARAAATMAVNTSGLIAGTGGTIMGWWKPSGVTTGVTQTLWSSYTDASNYTSVQYIHGTGFTATKRVAGVSTTVTSSTSATAGQWYHVGLIINANKTLDLVVNGAAAGTNTTNTTGTPVIATTMQFGSLATATTGTLQANGELWSWHVNPVVMTPQQVGVYYAKGK